MPWSELNVLKETCEVLIKSRLNQDHALVWTVSIRPMNGEPSIIVERPEVGDAVRDGIKRARDSGLLPQT